MLCAAELGVLSTSVGFENEVTVNDVHDPRCVCSKITELETEVRKHDDTPGDVVLDGEIELWRKTFTTHVCLFRDEHSVMDL